MWFWLVTLIHTCIDEIYDSICESWKEKLQTGWNTWRLKGITLGLKIQLISNGWVFFIFKLSVSYLHWKVMTQPKLKWHVIWKCFEKVWCFSCKIFIVSNIYTCRFVFYHRIHSITILFILFKFWVPYTIRDSPNMYHNSMLLTNQNGTGCNLYLHAMCFSHSKIKL